MATTPTPTPEPTPQPRGPIACPSCGSRYNPETRELVESTGLPEKIAVLEARLHTLRIANVGQADELATLRAENETLRQTPPAPAPAPEPRGKKARDFIVGER